MNRFIFVSLMLLFSISAPAIDTTNVFLGGRHMFVIYPGIDQFWGSYFFVVSNATGLEQAASFPVALPKQVSDWQISEGLLPDEITLTDEALVVSKAFPPGDSLIVLGFKVPASMGKATMEFEAPFSVGELVVMAKEDSIRLSSDSMDFAEGVPFSGQSFDLLRTSEIEAGRTHRIFMEGAATGRGPLQWVAWIFGSALFGLGFGFVWRRRRG